MNGTDPKQIARELLEEAHPALIGLSHWIHANPELGYQEVLASGWITEWLTTAGFEVRTGMAGMPTAVVGSYGPGPFHIAVCVEYDALPAVGHACGHNVIAAAGVGAGLALAAVADQLRLRVSVLGTPAEETGGGKVGMIKAGEFDTVHAALMVHPWPGDEATPTILAIRSLNVAYTGKEAHAAGFPYLGVNAADALVVAQTAIALLRQQLRSTDRVHGIVTKGGDAANIIPSRTEAQWMVRGTDVPRLDEVTALVRRCFEAGALATGATLEIEEEICYADVRHDPDLARLYQSNAEQLGRAFTASGMPVSTDMGNVSYVVPSIHPMIGISAGGAVNHQADFAAACATPSADQAIFDGALAMAWTAIDAALDVGLRERLMKTRPVGADVAMVSSAWKLPPLVAPVLTEAVAPVEGVVVDLDGEGVADMVAQVEVVAEAAEVIDMPADEDVLRQLDGDAPMADPVMEPEPAVTADRPPETVDRPPETNEPTAAPPVAAAEAPAMAADGQPDAAEPAAAPTVTASAAMAEPGMDAPVVANAVDVAEAEGVTEAAVMARHADDAHVPEPVADVDAVVWAAAMVDPQVDVPILDADAAWAADVDAVAQQIAEVSRGGGAPEVTADPMSEANADSRTARAADASAETSWGEPAMESVPADTDAEIGAADGGMEASGEAGIAKEVLFRGFQESVPEASEPAAEPAPAVWSTLDLLADEVDPSTPADAVAMVDQEASAPDDTWFAVDVASAVPAAAPAMADAAPTAGAPAMADAAPVPAAAPAMADAAPTAGAPAMADAAPVPAAAPAMADAAPVPAAAPAMADAAPTAGAPAMADAAPTAGAPAMAAAVATGSTALHDRDAWERAFEEAAARTGRDPQPEADVPSAVAGSVGVPVEGPGQRSSGASEAVSRVQVEAEGFSFVAPEVAPSRLEEYGEVWSRNGADHASEDISLR